MRVFVNFVLMFSCLCFGRQFFQWFTEGEYNEYNIHQGHWISQHFVDKPGTLVEIQVYGSYILASTLRWQIGTSYGYFLAGDTAYVAYPNISVPSNYVITITNWSAIYEVFLATYDNDGATPAAQNMYDGYVFSNGDWRIKIQYCGLPVEPTSLGTIKSYYH